MSFIRLNVNHLLTLQVCIQLICPLQSPSECEKKLKLSVHLCKSMCRVEFGTGGFLGRMKFLLLSLIKNSYLSVLNSMQVIQKYIRIVNIIPADNIDFFTLTGCYLASNPNTVNSL